MARGYVYEDDASGWRQLLASDLPSSGVTAATYGDSSHVGQFTVNAQGVVTSAANVAIAASGGITSLTSTGGSLTITSPTGPTTNADVAASGVAAATYGDSTHVAQVHVGADGRVTSASSVAISGSGGAGGLITLYDSGYLGAAAASIDTGAGGIASGHFTLMIVAYLRGVSANAGENIVGKFNNDSSALYNLNRIQNSLATVSGANVQLGTSMNMGDAPAGNAVAGTFGSFWAVIPAYDGTANFKAGTCEAGAAAATAAIQDRSAFSYQSTAAISRFAITTGTGGNWAAGSRMVIYGTQ